MSFPVQHALKGLLLRQWTWGLLLGAVSVDGVRQTLQQSLLTEPVARALEVLLYSECGHMYAS